MSAKSARNCRKAFRWAHIKKSWASGYTENTHRKPVFLTPLKGGVKTRDAGLFRCAFPVPPSRYAGAGAGEVCKKLQRGFSVLFRCAGAGLIYAHFSLREISKTADRGGAGHPWARFPCCALTPLLWAVNDTEVQLLPIAALSGTRARDAGRQGPRRFLPAAGAGAGAGAGRWCWCRALVPGAGAGAGAGACAVVLGAACRVACTVSVYPDWLYPA